MRTKLFSVEVTCKLGDEYFADWNELSPEIKEFWEKTELQSNCEGEGWMGSGCYECPFCDNFDEEESLNL